MQCRGGAGACPDTIDSTTGAAGTCTNDVTDVSGFVQEGQQCISFTRPFNPGKWVISGCDNNLILNFTSQSVIQPTGVRVTELLIPTIRTSTLSGALGLLERQPFNITQEPQVRIMNCTPSEPSLTTGQRGQHWMTQICDYQTDLHRDNCQNLMKHSSNSRSTSTVRLSKITVTCTHKLGHQILPEDLPILPIILSALEFLI